jgi:hypothetical protein
MKPKICILGTHHAYQYSAPRPRYLQNVRDLISIHSVDLVAEEAGGLQVTYAQELVEKEFKSKVSWKNVDLTAEEPTKIPDINKMGTRRTRAKLYKTRRRREVDGVKITKVFRIRDTNGWHKSLLDFLLCISNPLPSLLRGFLSLECADRFSL